MKITDYRCAFLILTPVLALAATGMGGPVTGYVADSSKPELRAILGLPGALHYSAPLPLPDGATCVVLARGGDFAWVERAGATPGVLFLSGGSADRFAPVEGALAASDWVAFSPGAAAVVLFSATANRLQVLTGLPNAPRVAMDLDAGTLPEQPAAAAVNDEGTVLLAASPHAVYLLRPGGGAQLVLSGERIHSLAMMPNGADAVVADDATGSIYVLQNLPSAPATRQLVSGLAAIGKIQPAWDGTVLLIAQPDTTTVSAVDMLSGALQSFPVDAAPVALEPLRNRDAFLISARPDEPGWIFWRAGGAWRALFIPTAQNAKEILP